MTRKSSNENRYEQQRVFCVVADCDLVALLDDDSGMDLLVSGKIISLDLPIRDVYKKVWLAGHSEVKGLLLLLLAFSRVNQF